MLAQFVLFDGSMCWAPPAPSPDARVVDDGDLITGGGVTSGLDVGLYIVEREVGPQVAHNVEKLFEHERRGTVWSSRAAAPAFTV